LELAETLIPSYRRALTFPLYRSWALADACRADVARILLRGTRTVLRCLLELRAILDAHEVYYVYSRIWLDDFCRWIQTCARYVIPA
jgi:protein SHQ1